MPEIPWSHNYKNYEDYKNAKNIYDQAVALEKQAKLMEERNRMLQQGNNNTSYSYSSTHYETPVIKETPEEKAVQILLNLKNNDPELNALLTAVKATEDEKNKLNVVQARFKKLNKSLNIAKFFSIISGLVTLMTGVATFLIIPDTVDKGWFIMVSILFILCLTDIKKPKLEIQKIKDNYQENSLIEKLINQNIIKPYD